MADVIETGGRDREVVVEREPRSSAGWIIAAIAAIVLLLWLFGGSLFNGAKDNNSTGTPSAVPETNTQLDTGTGTGTGTE